MILGLDLSLTQTGWCMIKDSGMTSGVIKSKLRGLERMQDIRSQVKHLLDSNGDTNLVVIEGYAYSPFKRGNTHPLVEMTGLVKWTIYRAGCDMLVVAPTTLKLFVGYGKYQKSDVVLQVFKRWNVEFDTEDETDSFVLAKLGEAYIQTVTGKAPKLPEFQARALKTVMTDQGGNNHVRVFHTKGGKHQ